jgi:hypothetical protein
MPVLARCYPGVPTAICRCGSHGDPIHMGATPAYRHTHAVATSVPGGQAGLRWQRQAVAAGRIRILPPCSGRHLACRRGRHPAARRSAACLRDGYSAGQDARLYGRQDARRYSEGQWQYPDAPVAAIASKPHLIKPGAFEKVANSSSRKPCQQSRFGPGGLDALGRCRCGHPSWWVWGCI